VIDGMNAAEPLSTRAARMKNYNDLVRELDAGGAHYSQELSEVDLGDPEDVKVMAADANGEVLVHLGSANFLQRYKTYVTHVQQWRQQFEKLESVDLRYDGQIIVNPDLDGMPRQPALTPAAARAAMAAGVKTAAIVNYEKYVAHPAAAAPPKKETKPKAKSASHQAARRAVPIQPVSMKPASVKPAPSKSTTAKSGPIHQAALNTTLTRAPTPAKNSVASHPVAPPPAAPSSTAVNTGQKKPSPGIPKETPQN